MADGAGLYLDQDAQDRKAAAAGSLLVSQDTSPDAYAKARKDGQTIGLPADIVAADPSFSQKASAARYLEAIANAPKTEAFVATPEAAKIAQDDVENLARIEKTMSFWDAMRGGVDKVQGMGYGFLEASGEGLGLRSLTEFGREGRTRNDAEAQQYGKRHTITGVQGLGDFGQWAKETIGEQLPMMAPSFAGGMAGAAIGAGAGTVTLPVIGTVGGAALGGVIGALIPSLVMGVGETQGQIKQKDKDAEAPGAAFAGGSVIALLDSALPGRIGGKLVSALGAESAEAVAKKALEAAIHAGVRGAAREAGKSAIIEAVTEGLQEVVGEVAAAYGTNQSIDWQGLPGQVAEAMAAGGLMGGGVHTVTDIVGNAANRTKSVIDQQRRAQQADAEAQFLDALVAGTVDAKTAERAPDLFSRYMASVVEGKVDSVYVPADVVREYAQSKMADPAFRLDDDPLLSIPAVREQLNEAAATGGDIVIPAAEYLTTVARSELHQMLKPDLRLSLDSMSLREARDVMSRKDDIIAAHAKEFQTEAAQISESAAPEVRVYDDIFTKLRQAGYGVDASRQYAAVIASRYSTRAARMGSDAWTQYQRMPISIENVAPEPLRRMAVDPQIDSLIEAARKGVKAPATGKMFGRSLSEFIAARGGVIDQGGELTDMGVDKVKHRGIGPVVRAGDVKTGDMLGGGGVNQYSLDDTARAAFEAGYFPELQGERPTPDQLIEALREEMAGKPRYAEGQIDTTEADWANAATELRDTLDSMGHDITAMTNDQVKEVIGRVRSAGDRIVAALDGSAPGVNDDVALPPDAREFNQVQNLPEWREKTAAWMEKNGYTQDEIDRHLAAIDGQMKIFQALGPVEVEMFPKGADLAGKKGPIRKNDDPIYKITFDASAMCVKRLEAAATAAYIQQKIGRALTASERMALTSMFRAAGKEAPCLYCYVEAPRSKQGDFVKRAQEMVFGTRAVPKSWSDKMKGLAEAAIAEAKEKGVNSVDANVVLEPKFAVSEAGQAERAKAPHVYEFLEKAGLAAKANLPKLYEEYTGQILDVPQELLDELSGYAGMRFFSSSDFQAEHVVDLMQAFHDLEVRKAKAHAYTKVTDFVDIFGKTGMKIQTSVFASIDANGKIAEDNWQGMKWADAQRLREENPNVGTVLVATDDAIVSWGLQQPWIDYIIPYHHSGLEKKYSGEMEWQDFTSTQSEKPMTKGEKADKIRMYEMGTVDGIADEVGTRAYLEMAVERKLMPVFPAFLFKDFAPEPGTDKKARAKATKAAKARWKAMIDAGGIDWDQINPAYFKLKKDYARTDTPFTAVTARFNLGAVDKVLQRVLAGEEAKRTVPDRGVGDRLAQVIEETEGQGRDIGVEAIRDVRDGAVPFTQGAEYTHEVLRREALRQGLSEQETLQILADIEFIRWGGEAALELKNDAETRNIIARLHDGVEALRLVERDTRGTEAAVEAGSGARRGRIGEPAAGSGRSYDQAAYHGSPHVFDKFSLDHIGSGEGAQAYGWGLYFAGNKAVAKYYRETLSQSMQEFGNTTPPPKGSVADKLATEYGYDGSRFENADDVFISDRALELGAQKSTVNGIEFYKFDDGSALLVADGGWDVASSPSEGRLYKVEIPDDGGYLLWDKPLSEQPDGVRDAITQMVENDVQRLKVLVRDARRIAEDALGENASKWQRALNDAQALVLRNADREITRSALLDIVDTMAVGGAPEDAIQRVEAMAEDVAAAANAVDFERDGGEFYRSLVRGFGSDKAASLALREAGIPGIKYLDGSSRSAGDGNYNYVIFDDSLVSIREYEQTKRGSISFQNGQALIRIFKDRDLSTMLHETSHLWLEELVQDAAMLDAPQQIRDDLQKVLDWFGVKIDVTAGDFMPDTVLAAITTDMHEQWARAGEAYFMEGKAPSTALQSAFANFKAWLTRIYQALANLHTPISDEIRSVFDRLIATDEQITAVRERQKLTQAFADATQMGATDAEFAAYEKAVAEAKDIANTLILKRAMDQVRQRREQEWKTEADEVKTEVEDRMNQEPVWRALRFLRKGEAAEGSMLAALDGHHLSRDAIVAMYGQEQVLKLLPFGVYRNEGGISPHDLAPLLGYATADDMMRSLMDNEAARKQLVDDGVKGGLFRHLVRQEVTRVMTDRHGDMLTDGSIEAEAVDAVHNEKQGQVLAAELRALHRQATRVKYQGQTWNVGSLTTAEIAAEWARRTVAAKKVGEIATPPALATLLRAEARAGKLAQDAILKGDHAEAYRQKQRQLLNHALYREAKRVAAQVDKDVKLLSKLAKKATIDGMDQGYLDQIHGLLERYEFKKVGEAALRRREALAAFVAKKEAEGDTVIIPAKLLQETQRQNFKRMTVDELSELADTVRNFAALGRLKQELIDRGERRRMDDLVEELAQQTSDMKLRDAPARRNTDKHWKDRAGKFLRGMDAALMKIEQLVDWVDGGKVDGVLSRIVFRPIREAEARANDMQMAVTKRIVEAFEKMTDAQRAAMDTEFRVPEFGMRPIMTKSAIVAMALNTGNESNLDKLIRGEKLTGQEEVDAILRRYMTTTDWRLVQEIWDTIESLWPEIAAQHKRLTGVDLPKIEPRSFEVQTSDGQVVSLRGGYFPAVYDPALSPDVEANMQRSDAGLFENIFSRPATAKGHTIERVQGYARPMLLDLKVVPNHLAQVIHRLAMEEALQQADRFLADPRVRYVLAGDGVNDLGVLGPEYYALFRPWLQAIANDKTSDARGPKNAFEAAFGKIRTHATMVGMGFRLSTMVAQVGGLSASQEYLGGKWLLGGIDAYMHDPDGVTNFVWEKSGEMKHRASQMDRDLRDAMSKMVGKGSMLDGARRFAFTGIAWMDRHVAVSTWMGAYNKALAEGLTDTDAAAAGDRAVALTQGSGGVKDLSAVQRGSDTQKLFTMFYSYFNVLYARQRDLGRKIADGETDFAGVFAKSWWLMIFPAVATDFLLGRWPDQEKDETWLAWGIKKILSYPFASVPVVRDVMGGLSSGFKYQMSPAAQIVDTVGKAGQNIKDIANGEEPKNAVKNTLNTAGYILGLPLGQAATTGQYIADVKSGETQPSNVFEFLWKAAMGGK